MQGPGGIFICAQGQRAFDEQPLEKRLRDLSLASVRLGLGFWDGSWLQSCSFKTGAGQGLPGELGGVLVPESYFPLPVDIPLTYLPVCPVSSLTMCSLLGPQGSFGDAGPAGDPVGILQVAAA